MPARVAGRPSHEKKVQPGDRVVMVGGRIGKDGIHGATFSSEELHEGSPVSAVQIGDPITQKRMFDFLLKARDEGLYTSITDNGAGGLSSSVGEMARDTGGATLDLDLAPLKYPGLHEAVYRYNIYYITRDTDGVWRAGDRSKLPLPVSKATADRLAVVHDTGHEFARPRRIVIDSANRPYIRFQEGVSDWTSGRVIVPLETRYAALQNGVWQVTPDVPDEWPAPVQQLIDSPGDPVAGAPRPSPWFIFEKRGLSDQGRSTYVFLHHLEGGYAVRGGGPAWPPGTK